MSSVVLIHSLLFILFWLTNLTFKQEVNQFLADVTGFKFDFLLLFLIISLLCAIFSGMISLRKNKKFRPAAAWILTSLGSIYLLLFYGSFIVLFIKNPVQVSRLGQMYQYFRIFPDAVLLFLAGWGLQHFLPKITNSWAKSLLILAFVILWILPTVLPPGMAYEGKMPDKPRLIAHRGASLLAPENTMASMNAASDMGIFGLETDITISYDGVLFLVHDSTLERTTNVAEIFPGREETPAGQFTWAEISRLDAGKWFPGPVSFAGEPIPRFTDLLEFIAGKPIQLIYDLRSPPVDHPQYDEILVLCLNEIQVTGVDKQTWILATSDEIPVILSVIPEAILAKGVDYDNPPSPQELNDLGYKVVNSEFGISNRMITAYRSAGLWVNVWTVDETWQFSRLWLAGVDSVTSNEIQKLNTLSRPILAVRYPIYLVIWGLVGVICAAVTSLTRKKGN